jgi:hypothetical protein
MTEMKNQMVIASAVLTLACATLPPAPAARSDTAVNASFGRTWEAVVDYFARSSIPVKTIDRSSGLIAAEATVLAGDNSNYATCSNGFLKFHARGASFNALVRGDSTRSSVRVTATWMSPTPPGGAQIQCVTSDAWEKQFESAIKAKAETK